jgi:hypothetical protein
MSIRAIRCLHGTQFIKWASASALVLPSPGPGDSKNETALQLISSLQISLCLDALSDSAPWVTSVRLSLFFCLGYRV